MQYKKYKNQAGINLNPPPPPSQNSHFLSQLIPSLLLPCSFTVKGKVGMGMLPVWQQLLGCR